MEDTILIVLIITLIIAIPIIRFILSYKTYKNSMTLELLNETYNKLSKYANADDYTKFQHINNK